jgi:D-alanine transaminase
MKNLGYYNGHYDEIENMVIPMNDRAHYFGDGVYDATYSRNHIIWNLQEHLDRLYNSARLLEIEPPCSKEEMAEILKEMVKKVDDGNQFVYWQVTRGTADRNHAFPKGVKSNLWIMLRPRNVSDNHPVKVVTTEDTRFLHCNIKTLNLIPSVLANQRAVEANCDEAVLHRGSRVTECAHSNISILKDGVLRTAPTDELILPGITRKHLIELAKQNNIPVDESPFSMVELMNADEIIVTSSSALCIRVATIDKIPVGGKDPERIKLLQDAYWNKFVTETTPKA